MFTSSLRWIHSELRYSWPGALILVILIFGMLEAVCAAAKLYEDLLNKYNKNLLATQKPDDKRSLV